MSILKPLCVAWAIALGLTATGQSQDLATLAKKEKQRQAKARAEGSGAKVYTGVGGSAAADPSASPDSPAPASPPASPGNDAAGTNGGSPASSSRNRPAVSRGEAEPPTARSYRTVNVTIYITSWCGYCRKARAFLATQPNVIVVAHDIEQSKARHAEMVAKAGRNSGVPVIDIEGIILKGFSAPSITNALNTIRNR